jgi:hypothetical protein
MKEELKTTTIGQPSSQPVSSKFLLSLLLFITNRVHATALRIKYLVSQP